MAAKQASREVDRAPARRLQLPVVDRRVAGRDFVWLTLEAPRDWRSRPGQFLNVLCESDLRGPSAAKGRVLDPDAGWPEATGPELRGRRPLVRRPYSVSRVLRDGEKVRLVLLVQRVGPGSRFLQDRPVGSPVDVVGPLGNHFTAPSMLGGPLSGADDRLGVLVAGGCGLAPIFGLADEWVADGRRVLFFFGAASLEVMPLAFRERPRATGRRVEETGAVEAFSGRAVRTILATEDGSAGFRGPVTAALERYLDEAPGGKPAGRRAGKPIAIYACGPRPMLRTLAEIARRHEVPCQVSLEEFMGCGIGVCLSCVVKVRDARSPNGWTYRLTCREGPVVDAHEIIWDEI